jgi:isocitrate/isopropylmalate dehydrogenase
MGLKGPTATPIGGGHASINVALRKKLGLYVNFRPVRMLPGLKTRYDDLAVDFAIFRENTGDLYAGLEHEVVAGVVRLNCSGQNAFQRRQSWQACRTEDLAADLTRRQAPTASGCTRTPDSRSYPPKQRRADGTGESGGRGGS